MRSLKTAARVLAFTFAPCITDAEGFKLAFFIVVVSFGAAYGWSQE